MYIVSINADKCKGCKDCQDLCPSSLLGMEGDKAAVTGDSAECMGCQSCVAICEEEAIEVAEY